MPLLPINDDEKGIFHLSHQIFREKTNGQVAYVRYICRCVVALVRTGFRRFALFGRVRHRCYAECTFQNVQAIPALSVWTMRAETMPILPDRAGCTQTMPILPAGARCIQTVPRLSVETGVLQTMPRLPAGTGVVQTMPRLPDRTRGGTRRNRTKGSRTRGSRTRGKKYPMPLLPAGTRGARALLVMYDTGTWRRYQTVQLRCNGRTDCGFFGKIQLPHSARDAGDGSYARRTLSERSI